LLQLRQYPWWPTTWVSTTGRSASNDEIVEHGIFQNARRSAAGLILEAVYQGLSYTGTIRSPDLSQDDLVLLRHILLQHYGEPMRVVASLDF
jgi:hypothetical protein